MIFQNDPFAALSQFGQAPSQMAGPGGFAGPMPPQAPSLGGMGMGGMGGNLGRFAGAFGANLLQQQGNRGGMFGNPLAMLSPMAALMANKPKLGMAAMSPLLGGLNLAGVFK